MAIVVVIILFFILFEIFYQTKIGRIMCVFTGNIILAFLSKGSYVLSGTLGISSAGIDAACGLLFF